MINTQSKALPIEKKTKWNAKFLLNLRICALAVVMLFVGAGLMSLLSYSACEFKPVAAVMFAIYLAIAPLAVLWSVHVAKGSTRQIEAVLCTAICVVFLFGGMLLF